MVYSSEYATLVIDLDESYICETIEVCVETCLFEMTSAVQAGNQPDEDTYVTHYIEVK